MAPFCNEQRRLLPQSHLTMTQYRYILENVMNGVVQEVTKKTLKIASSKFD